MLMAAEHWYELDWFEWLGVAGLPLTLFGLWLTLQQARQAADAARAARAAVRQTQRQIVAKQLHILIPQLTWVARELDASIKINDSESTKRSLDDWRRHASHVHGLLSSESEYEQESLLEALVSSTGLARTAARSLLSGEEGPVLPKCRRAHDAIGSTCDELIKWAGKNANQVITGDEGA
ncbi:hypothetical protein [Micromonospora inaquosa]|uniref:hypothetical protein n=1 Tax=Micromonospora inaquosa TaxID=2203716 RepID=UPI000F5EA6B4|nr:hypothetical protein [Micromonospora inaquosa]